MTSSTVRIGIIGCGYWGPNLLRNFFGLPDVSVRAVCDLVPARLDLVRRQYPSVAHLSENADDILTSTEIDAVVIATPIATHFELARKALQHGKHLLIEKPLTPGVRQAVALIELAEKNKLRLMVDHTFIYTGAVQTMKQVFASDELGDVYYFDSVRVNLGLFQHDVNVVWDLAPHDLSIMDYLLNREPVAVSAVGVDHLDAGQENMAYLTLRFDNHLIAHIHVNWLAPVKVRKTLVCGAKKMVIYDDMEPSEKVRIYDRGVDFVQSRDDIYDMLVQYRTGDMRAPRIDLTEALNRVAIEFRDAVLQDRPPLTDGHAGLRVVRILEAADRSMKHSGRLEEILPHD